MVKYALVEHQLTRIIYGLCNLGHKDGRIIVREPRSTDRLSMILDLLSVRGLALKETDIPLLRDALSSAKEERDKVAHGIWLQDPENGKLFIRVTRGSWQPDPKMRGKVKRVISPEGQEVVVDDLRTITNIIHNTSGHIGFMETEIEAMIGTSLHKLPELSPMANHTPSQTDNTQSPPDEPSQG